MLIAQNLGGKTVLTVDEVARALRCSKAHVYKAIKGGVSGVPPIPSIAIGRRRLVREDSLLRWMAANERSVADAGMIRSSPEVDTEDA